MDWNKESFQKIFKLNPSGNPQEIFNYLSAECFTNSNGLIAYGFDKKPLTVNILYEKYKEYVRWWNCTHGKKDQKYIRTEDKKLDLKWFVIQAKYNESFVIEQNQRDKYLFGNMSLQDLTNGINQFKQMINERTINEG